MKQKKGCTRSRLLREIKRTIRKWLNDGRGELKEVFTEVGDTIQLAIISRPTRKKYELGGQGMVRIAPELKPLQRSEILNLFQRLEKLFSLTVQPAIQKAKKVVCTFVLPATPSLA